MKSYVNCAIIKVGTCQQWIRRKEVLPMGTLKDESSTHQPESIMTILSLYEDGWFVEDIEERFDEVKKYAVK